MARANNPTLGSIPCECGRQADVKQRGGQQRRFLYTHCSDCGADQRTGKAVQTRLWFGTAWRDGLKPVDPPKNVDDKPPEPMQNAPEQIPVKTVDVEEFDPDEEIEKVVPGQASEPPKKNGGKFIKGAATMGGLFLIAVGIVRSL